MQILPQHKQYLSIININNVITTNYDGFKNTNDAMNYAKTNNLMSYYPILTALDGKNKNNINGFNDWYIPSQQEFTLLYKHFKPDVGCSKYNTSSCISSGEGITVNTSNLICNVCSISTINQTTNTNFQIGNTESISHLPSNLVNMYSNRVYTIPLCSKLPVGTPNTMSMNFTLSYANIYQNVFGAGWIDGLVGTGNAYISQTRLVRRVLVSW